MSRRGTPHGADGSLVPIGLERMAEALYRTTPSRRGVLGGLGLAAAGLAFAGPSGAARAVAALPEGIEAHGLSVFGDLKYPVDFKHFAYVRADAPKGGRLSTIAGRWAFNQNPQTFNSLNTLILKGDAAVGLTVIYDSLMVRALDEPDAVYGLVAKSVRAADGGNTFVFTLRPEARWHDGTPLTAEDVAFSLTTLKEKGHPQITETIRDMVSATAEGFSTVVVKLSGKQSRGLIQVIATLPIVSKAYYASHDFEQSTLDVPLGSGPYKVGRFDAGRYIEYERVADYWAKDLPVNVGQNNFDVIRYEMYRERTTAFEGFKAGQYLLREEFTSIVWAQQYDFPAFKDGRVVRFELSDGSPSGAQGWFLNTRREKFADPRVREAIGLAFDFEWSNKNLFFGSYRRTHSFFENSDLKASGKPSPEELALLEPFRSKVPDEVFDEPWSPPVSDGSGRDRKLFRRANELFTAAGWVNKDGKLRNAKGETLDIEFLDSDPIFGRVVGPYVQNLAALGVNATSRVVDPSQFEKRLRDFDYDAVVRRYSLSPTPDEGMRLYWGSKSAAQPGSSNLSGIRDPIVDALIEQVLAAPTRPAMVAAARALDRVLRAGRYWVPHWFKASHWMAMWDVYGRPDTPPYDLALAATWWVDRDKAKRLDKGL